VSEVFGQVWCAALAPNWRQTEDGAWERGLVQCHTTQMSPSHEGRRFNRCDLHGGKAEWGRCKACPDNFGVTALYSDEYPELVRKPECCRKGDFDYDGQRKECRRCNQRAVCLGVKLHQAKRVRLVIVS
jgi:hypothetical protein